MGLSPLHLVTLSPCHLRSPVTLSVTLWALRRKTGFDTVRLSLGTVSSGKMNSRRKNSPQVVCYQEVTAWQRRVGLEKLVRIQHTAQRLGLPMTSPPQGLRGTGLTIRSL